MIRLRSSILIPTVVLVLLLTLGGLCVYSQKTIATFTQTTAAAPVPSRPSRHISAAAVRRDGWRILGPGGGGAQYNHAISPLDPNIMLASCDMSGNYISKDGGETWRMFNLRGQASAFVFDPADANVIYALAAGIYRTEDAGDTWKIVYPAPSSIRGLIYSGDEATTLLNTNLGIPGRVTALAVDPENRKILYAAPSNTVVMSTDYGATWKQIGKIATGATRQILVDPYSAKENRTVYALTWDRLYIYEQGVWRGTDPVPDTKQVLEATGSFSPTGPTFYALIPHRFEGDEPKVLGGLMVSYDRGSTWKQAHGSMLDSLANRWFLPNLRAITAVPEHPHELYLSYSNLRLKPEPNTAYFGVAHTSDGGASWEYLWQSAAKQPENIRDSWLTELFGPYWGENPLSMAAHNNILIEGDLGRTMRSTDGGKSWDAVYSRRFDDGYSSTGLDVTTSYGVHFDPFDANRLFISYTDIGLFRSDTGGDTWVSSATGVNPAWRNTTYWMEFDPAKQGRAWAVMSNTHDLPRTRIFSRGTANFKGGVMASDDGGRTWSKSNAGMEETACTHILLDPRSPVDSRTLYVAGFGRGVYRSTDGGANWELKKTGLPESEPLVWRLALHGETLYAVVVRRKDDGKFGSANDGGIYQSTDQGETWSKMELPAGLNGPTNIAFAAEDPNRIYVSSWARTDPVFARNYDGGVFVSPDGGKTWENTLKDPNIYEVTVDPQNPKRVYAAGFEASAWRSDDAGINWYRIRGFNFKAGHRIIPDPRDRDRIFITTFGGSVWYGPAAGDPEALEDIVTPALMYSAK